MKNQNNEVQKALYFVSDNPDYKLNDYVKLGELFLTLRISCFIYDLFMGSLDSIM